MAIFGLSIINKEQYRKKFSNDFNNLIENSNLFFEAAYRCDKIIEYAKNSLVKTDCKPYKKTYRDRFADFSGLSAKQAFYVELHCLSRLNNLYQEGQHHPFPLLLSFDMNRLEVEQSYCGKSLRTKRFPVKIKNLDEQVRLIARKLEEAGIVHLDNVPNGKNITVDKLGKLYLIDFDLAAIDGVTFGKTLIRRQHEFYQRGGYQYFENQLKLIVESRLGTQRA